MNPASSSIWLKLAHSVVAIGLTLVLTLLTGLAVLGHVSIAKEAMEPLFKFNDDVSQTAVAVTALVIVLLPLAVMIIAQRKGWLTWAALGVAWLAVVPVLGWLAWDDAAIRRPLPIDQFSPAFPGAEQSEAVLMRYSKNKPGEEAVAFGKMKWAAALGASPQDGAKWRDRVVKQRAEIEADWPRLAPQRRWVDELNTYDRIGDLMPSRYDANLIRFDVWRILSQHVCAHATLLAMDGHRDEAIATLLPLLEVSRKLQPSARSLVRLMIAAAVERMTVETAAQVLDAGPVSAENRARLAAALAGRNPAAGARRIMLMEYAGFAPLLGQVKLGDAFDLRRGSHSVLRRPLNLLSGLLINPNATMNLYGDKVYALAALAEKREIGQVAVQSRNLDDTLLRRGGMKNLGGRLMLVMAIPNLDKALDSYWKLDDACNALAARLQPAEHQSLAKPAAATAAAP